MRLNEKFVTQDYQSADAAKDLLDGFSLCFWLTMAQAVPWIFVLVFVLYLVIAAINLPLVLITAGVQFIVQALAYSHVD